MKMKLKKRLFGAFQVTSLKNYRTMKWADDTKWYKSIVIIENYNPKKYHQMHIMHTYCDYLH